ncbi:PspC domain-containing protein [Streptomyces sp. NPDC088725]|uniref:PspC domain-containing protein n=1 Tax=Streptomyces sp. NPDC088725 TaxID=3365873 RepID=UPI0037FC8A99
MTQPPRQSPPEPAGATAVPPPGASDGGSGGGTRPALLRSPRQKVVAGVCGGLGRYCDIDPVIFRIVIGVLTVTGGIGLIFYGFAWLLIPLEGEEENEARRMLTGRVDGSSLIAILLALIGCGLFLSMLGDGGTLGFAAMLTVAVVGSAVWSQRRRVASPPDGSSAPSAPHVVVEAPPETKAPPAPGGSPSWWRDPIIKDGTTGPVAGGYLWGPADFLTGPASREPGRPADGEPGRPVDRSAGFGGAVPVVVTGRPRGRGGLVFLLALIAAGLGTGLSWNSQPLGTSLEIGLVAALTVFALGLVAGAFLGRVGIGTVFLTVITAGLLAASAAIPKDIGTEWGRETWKPASAASVQPRYTLGSGVGTLDLSGLSVPEGRTVRTSAEVGVGRLKVVVPAGLTVKMRVEAGVGDIRLPGEPPNDVDVAPDQSKERTLSPQAGTEPAGTLVLRLDVGVGQVEVTRSRANPPVTSRSEVSQASQVNQVSRAEKSLAAR